MLSDAAEASSDLLTVSDDADRPLALLTVSDKTDEPVDLPEVSGEVKASAVRFALNVSVLVALQTVQVKVFSPSVSLVDSLVILPPSH